MGDAVTDYTYYKNEYGGALSEEDFAKFRKAAQAVIHRLLLPRHPADYPQKADAIRCAVCLQTDKTAGCSDSAGLAAETIGDYRAEYRTPALTVLGMEVSPEALMVLSHAGLLNQWI